MRTPLAPSLALARAVGAVARLSGRGGTSLPGRVLLRLDDDALPTLAGRLANGSAVISATNGKTTTATMAARVLERAGHALVHNRAGANMAGGVASTLLAATRRDGGVDGDIGLFEVDEFWLEQVVHALRPRVLVLGNLFRDQLDRYGELETIADRWAQLVRSRAGGGTRLVLNADDPLVADLGRPPLEAAGPPPAEDALYFGIEGDSALLASVTHAADAKHCRRCGTPYVYDAVYLGHLGRYHCPACGQARPQAQVSASEIELRGLRGAGFKLTTPAGSATVELELPGLYNVYNALAAAALATTLGVELADIVAGLESAQPAFGRGEVVAVDGRDLRILLVKNPAGANEVLRTLELEPGQHTLLGVLNDRTADGRDVSWVWDADFEILAARIARVVCAGTRAAELGVRFKYAGVPDERIEVEPSLPTALVRALGAAGKNAPTDGGGARPTLYALPTYTAMLELRELLVARGEARSSWA